MDRDGCLTEEVGYVNHPSRIRLLPRTAEAVCRLNRAGVAAVMVTNQTGIARGYFTEETLHAANARMREALEAGGARLDGLYVCMHHPSEGEPPYRAQCDCRKPRPGLLHRAAADAVALPARYEPFGNVHLEALASGVPVLSSARTGGSEIVRQGANG